MIVTCNKKPVRLRNMDQMRKTLQKECTKLTVCDSIARVTHVSHCGYIFQVALSVSVRQTWLTTVLGSFDNVEVIVGSVWPRRTLGGPAV